MASSNFEPQYIDEWIPENSMFEVKSEIGVGSIIIFSIGYINGLSGRLNPIKDSFSRAYIYGDNISFDDIDLQPYHLNIGAPFTAEDNMRHRFELNILKMIGQTALMRYKSLEGQDINA